MPEHAAIDNRESSHFAGSPSPSDRHVSRHRAGLSLPVTTALLVSGQDISPGILLSVIFLLGAAVLVTALSERPCRYGDSSPGRSAGAWALRGSSCW